MFDINTVNKRYFEIKLSITNDDGEVKELSLKVEPPKIKVIKKITSLAKSADEDIMDNLAEAVRLVLSKNKSKTKVPDEYVDEFDLDELNAILTAYFDWLNKEKNSPN